MSLPGDRPPLRGRLATTLVNAIDRHWSWVRAFFGCLKTAWVATASVVLGFLMFGTTPQVQDLFLEVQGGAGGSGILSGAPLWLSFYLAVALVWALPVYICARWILARSVALQGSQHGDAGPATRDLWRRIVPALLAVGCFAAVLAGQLTALANAPSIVTLSTDPRAASLNAELAQAVKQCGSTSLWWCWHGLLPLIKGLAVQFEYNYGAADMMSAFYALLVALGVWIAARHSLMRLGSGRVHTAVATGWWLVLAVLTLVAALATPVIYEFTALEGSKPLGLGHLTVLPGLTLLAGLAVWLALRPQNGGTADGEAMRATAARVEWTFLAVLVLSIVLIAVPFIVHPVDVGGYVFRSVMLPFLLGLLVGPFTWLTYYSLRVRAPLVLVAVLAISCATIFAGDTNDVRTIAGTPREPLRKSVERWAAVNGCSVASPEAARACPSPVIVAAAGGASRSAFHVAGVIGKLMDETGRTQQSGHQGPVWSAVFSPDGARIVTTSADDTARIWDAATGKQIARLREAHYYARVTGVRGAAFSPDGRLMVTAHQDVRARVWDLASGKLIASTIGHSEAMVTAVFSPGGRRIVTSSHDKTARIWDALTGKPVAVLKGHEQVVVSAVFSVDGQRVLTASDDGTAGVWNAADGAPLYTLKGHGQAVNKASYSPDGKMILTASDDGTARLWSAQDGKQIFVLKGHADAIYDASFSADGRFIVTASDDATARVWEVGTGEAVAQLKGHSGKVRRASFSPDGRRIVTASHDTSAGLWEAASGRLIAVAKGHEGAVNGAAFSPDGRRVVTASDDKLARVWDASSGAPVLELKGNDESLRLQPFAKQLFAISAVSGGALAAVVTYAGIADSQRKDRALRGQGAPPCKEGIVDSDWFAPAMRLARKGAQASDASSSRPSWRDCLQQLLAGDFLSPVMATLATSDLVHIRGSRGDRGAVLETAWERRYARFTAQTNEESTLAQPLAGLRRKVLAESPDNWLPILLLNGTSVTTGRRIVTSDVDALHAGEHETYLYKDSYDLHTLLGYPGKKGGSVLTDCPTCDIRLSTGATMSARFPVISPHGNIRGRDGAIVDRVVDGGYFENFGATTAGELSRALIELGLEPFIVLINNEPSTFTMECNPESSSVVRPDAPQTTWFATLASPLKALMGTRESRGSHAAAELCTLIGRLDRYAFITVAQDHFGSNKELSMSWWLSKNVQKYLDDQLGHEINRGAFKTIEQARKTVD